MAGLVWAIALGAPAPAAGAPFAYVTNNLGGDVSVIDEATLSVVATIPVGMYPYGVAVNQAGTRVYVANGGDRTVSVIDANSNTVITTITDIGSGATGGPAGVAVSRDGSRVYIVDDSDPGRLFVIDAATNAVIARILVQYSPAGVAVSPDGKRAYVTNQFSSNPFSSPGSVSVIDTETATVISTIPAGDRPFGIALNPTGTMAYVANFTGGSVSVIDTTSNAVTATIPVAMPTGLVVHPSGDQVYVANYGDGTVTVIDATSNGVIGAIPAGGAFIGLGLDRDGSRLYVANFETNSVTVIDTANRLSVGTIPVGFGPVGFGEFVGASFRCEADADCPGGQCLNAGTCDVVTGICSNASKSDGSPCSDNNACTQADACLAGRCTGTNPVDCISHDECHDVGVCDPTTGQCSNPAKADGSVCDDGDACTQADSCRDGVCVGGIGCVPTDQCHVAGTCDPVTRSCTNPPKPNGTTCEDGDACTTDDQCLQGLCIGGAPPACDDGNRCTDDSCNPATGCVHENNHVPCEDGSACATDDACLNGTCVGGPLLNCDDDNPCTIDTCSAASGCVHTPMRGCIEPCHAASGCDDGDPCTLDECHAGTCTNTIEQGYQGVSCEVGQLVIAPCGSITPPRSLRVALSKGVARVQGLLSRVGRTSKPRRVAALLVKADRGLEAIEAKADQLHVRGALPLECNQAIRNAVEWRRQAVVGLQIP